ncbi:hypothetical protein [Tumebacillus lipolyticus]|uniref:Uncharacterized protein n=1 Tax=Tumebacillus lipolyticus TaxID=1280370 RepID=A0ABW4ZYN1_9BACL
MRNLKLFYHTVTAQVVIILFILIKILLVPFLIWTFLGTSALAMVVLDVSTIVLGTALALSMGMVGYYQARFFSHDRPLADALLYMSFVHGPAALFLLYKWGNGAAWDTHLLLFFSGWLSMFSHPMNLVGFYGQWVDGVALLAMAGCYLLGVFLFHDDQRHENVQGVDFQQLRVKGRLK